jgi:hypothetical protein
MMCCDCASNRWTTRFNRFNGSPCCGVLEDDSESWEGRMELEEVGEELDFSV